MIKLKSLAKMELSNPWISHSPLKGCFTLVILFEGWITLKTSEPKRMGNCKRAMKDDSPLRRVNHIRVNYSSCDLLFIHHFSIHPFRRVIHSQGWTFSFFWTANKILKNSYSPLSKGYSPFKKNELKGE